MHVVHVDAVSATRQLRLCTVTRCTSPVWPQTGTERPPDAVPSVCAEYASTVAGLAGAVWRSAGTPMKIPTRQTAPSVACRWQTETKSPQRSGVVECVGIFPRTGAVWCRLDVQRAGATWNSYRDAICQCTLGQLVRRCLAQSRFGHKKYRCVRLLQTPLVAGVRI